MTRTRRVASVAVVLLFTAVGIGSVLLVRQSFSEPDPTAAPGWQRVESLADRLERTGWTVTDRWPPCGDSDQDGFVELTPPAPSGPGWRSLEALLREDGWTIDQGVADDLVVEASGPGGVGLTAYRGPRARVEISSRCRPD